MSRLRRTRCESFSPAVAAELLETRSLLSAGAAAAQAALHHAQSAAHGAQPGLTPSAAKVVYDVEATLSFSGQSLHVPGTMTVSKIRLTPGSHITAHVTLNGLPKDTIKGTITGQVQSWLVGVQDTTVTMTTGGKLVEHSPTLHPPNVFLPSTKPTAVTFFTGTQTVEDVECTFLVKGIPVGFVIHTI